MTSSKTLQLTKLEAARRQLETSVKLFFDHGDEVSIHTLVAAGYAIVRDINKHRGGDSMIKDDLNGLPPPKTLASLGSISTALTIF